MLRLSLRARIVLWNAIMVGLTLGLLAVVSLQQVRSSVYQSIDETLRSRSLRRTGILVNSSPTRNDAELLRASRVEVLPGLNRPRFLKPDGTSASQLPDRPWDRTAMVQCLQSRQPVYSEAETAEGAVRVYTRPILDKQDNIRYITQHIYLLNEAEAALGGVRASFLAIAPIALLITLGAAFISANRAVTPIAKMAEEANSISASDLDQRLQVTGSDEPAALAAAFNALLDRLRDAFDQQRRLIDGQRNFIADASNELRGPLTAIKTSADLALSGERDARTSLEQIRRSTTDTDVLVGQMLSLARADARLGEYNTPLDIFTLLLDCYERWEPQVGEELALEAPRKLPPVLGDERQLREVLDNLVQNCIRHAPGARIRLAAEETDRSILVVVSDNGPGISPDDIDRVFDRFYRGRADRHKPGTGLGLAICKEIIEAHGGHIRIYSRDGAGTTVSFTLPKSEQIG